MLASVRRPISTGGLYDGINPVIPYFDGLSDGLTDGQEVNGWTVMVAKEVNGDMQTHEKVFRTDPTENNSNLRLDSDMDGISDRDEIAMSALCDYTPGNLSDWKSNNSALYNKYEWFINNRAKKAWDDCSGNESEKWSEWNQTIQSQFNPYVKENIPPIITAFSSDFEYDTAWYGVTIGAVDIGLTIVESIWVRTEVSVFDAGRIANLNVDLTCGVSVPTLSLSGIIYTSIESDIGSETYTDIAPGLHSFAFVKSVDGLTWAAGEAVGFDAKVTAMDIWGHATNVTLHRDGLMDKAWDFLTEIWDQFAGAVTAAVNAAVDAVNAIWNWIVEKVTAIINTVLEVVTSAIDTFITAMKQAIDTAFKFVSESAEKAAEAILDAALSGYLFYALFGLATALQAISTILSIYSFGGAAVAGNLIIPMLLEIMFKAIIFKTVVTAAVSIAGIATIAGILHFVFPEKDDFWKEGLGLSVFSIGQAFAKLVTKLSIVKADITGVAKEILSFGLAVFGVIISLKSAEWGVNAAWIGLILAGLGALGCFWNKDIFDLDPFSPLRSIEEIFSLTALGYSITNVCSYYTHSSR